MEKKTYKITDEVTPIRVFTAEDIKSSERRQEQHRAFLPTGSEYQKRPFRHGKVAEIHRMVLLPDY